MPGTKSYLQRNLLEQIEEVKRKTTLLEGDRKAYFENAEQSMKQNRDKIARLRQENNEIYKQKAVKLAADEHVVSKGLEDNPQERTALRNKPGMVAATIMDEKIGDKVNALNTARYKTKQKQSRLHDLQLQYKQLAGKDNDKELVTAGGSRVNSGVSIASVGSRSDMTASDLFRDKEVTENDEEQKQRDLENRLDKALLKCREAEHIQKTYLQIKMKLEDEHQSFGNILDSMEMDLVRMKQQLKELKVLRNDALIVRDRAKNDLVNLEKKIYADRRARDLEMQSVKREADEKRQQQEQFQRRIAARSSMGQDELNPEQRQVVEEDQEKIRSLEEAFRRIKEATGVSDTQEVVIRFENQGDTQRHLEQLKTENEREIARLIQDKDVLMAEYADLKYTGEVKIASGVRQVEENQAHVKEEEDRKNEAQEQLERTSKILSEMKTGVEHLAEKLKIFKASSSDPQKAKTSLSANEYVLDQLTVCEDKLLTLISEIQSTGSDVNQLVTQIETEELHIVSDIKLPAHNTRVKLPAVSKDTLNYDDEDASGEDEDVMTRQGLKKQSQQIIDAKTRRRPGKRKKKGSK